MLVIPKLLHRFGWNSLFTFIFNEVPRTFTWLAYWRLGVTRDWKQSTMTLQVVSLIRPSKSKQHGTKNNRLWLSTCSQVIKPWLLQIQHGKPCHTFAELGVEVFRGACFKYQVTYLSSYFWKLLKFGYKETYGTITSENLGYSLTNSLLWWHRTT